MRLSVSDCLDGLRRRIRSGNWLTLVEMLALALLVLQGARLLWAVVTPVGSYGAWEGRQAQIPEAAVRQVLFASFEPFFRAGQPASGREVVVTSLALQVYGIRLNEIGRAHVCTPVTNAHLVCRHLLQKKERDTNPVLPHQTTEQR